jgi:NADPH-dependent 2,4-dienoyl-CoA reductase/sulfur reductase-like enzyme
LSCRLAELRGKGRVERAVLADGTSIPCDLVVVGIGVTPAVAWLAGSGIEMENGVLVNEYAETSLPGVYAAGDVANGWNPLFQERIRVEHYDNAQNQQYNQQLTQHYFGH